MRWLVRLVFVSFGLFLMLNAMVQLRAGQFAFDNASYHQTTFAAGGIGVGALFILLAFLPSGQWVFRHISTRKQLAFKPLSRTRGANGSR
jgi:hypothetical protein